MTVSLTAQDVASQLIDRYGAAWNREVALDCEQAYLPLHTSTADSGVMTLHDVSYGPHLRHRLDVYCPVNPASHPVVIFFHGGGLFTGDKQLPNTGGRFYANIGKALAKRGVVALIANYRLVPEAHFPDGGDDVAQCVRWAQEHAGEYGGDPARTVLFGNSAGAVHVATYLFRNWQEGEIRRAILLSTPCTMPLSGPREAVTRAYYGPNDAQIEAHFPLGLLRNYQGPCPPLHFMTAEYDPAEILAPCEEFVQVFSQRYGVLSTNVVTGHNHITTVLSIGTDDQQVLTRILAIVG